MEIPSWLLPGVVELGYLVGPVAVSSVEYEYGWTSAVGGHELHVTHAAVVQQASMSPAARTEWSCHENKNCFDGPNIRTLLLCSSI